MNIEALIETQAKLYKDVKAACEKIIGKLPPQSEVDAVFTAVHNWQMNEAIDKQQTERYRKKQQSDDEPPTAAQLRYAEDLEIEIPDNCTKKQLSKLINDRAGR